MAGPGKGYISKKDPRREAWEALQGTSAGGSKPAASAAAYNPTYDASTGTIASPFGSGRIPVSARPPTSYERLTALRKKRADATDKGDTQSKLRNMSTVSKIVGDPDLDPALQPNSVTGLSPAKQQEATKALSGIGNRKLKKPEVNRNIEQQFRQTVIDPRTDQRHAGLIEKAYPTLKDKAIQLGYIGAQDYKNAKEEDKPAAQTSPFRKAPDPDKIEARVENSQQRLEESTKNLNRANERFLNMLTPDGYLKRGVSPSKARRQQQRAIRYIAQYNQARKQAAKVSKRQQAAAERYAQIARGLVKSQEPIFTSQKQEMLDAQEAALFNMTGIPGAGRFVKEAALDIPNIPKNVLKTGSIPLGVAKTFGGTVKENPADAFDAATLALMFTGAGSLSRVGRNIKVAATVARVTNPNLGKVGGLVQGAKEVSPIASKAIELAGSPTVQRIRKGVGGGLLGGIATDVTVGRVTDGKVGGYVEPALTGTQQALIDDPWGTAKTSLEVLLSGIAAPFAIAGNVGLTTRRSLGALEENATDYEKSQDYKLGPVRRLAEETLTEAKNMVGVYTSKDAEKIATATAEVYGILPAMGAFWLLRPFTKGAIRGTGNAVADGTLPLVPGGSIPGVTDIAFNMRRAMDDKRVRSRVLTAAGRAFGLGDGLVAALDRPIRRNAKLNSTLKGSQLVTVIDEENQRAGGFSKTEPLGVLDLVLFRLGMGMRKITNDEQFKKLRDGVDVDSPVARLANLMTDPTVKAFFNDDTSKTGKQRVRLEAEIMRANEILQTQHRADMVRQGRDNELEAQDELGQSQAIISRSIVEGFDPAERPSVAIQAIRDQNEAELAGLKQSIVDRRTTYNKKRIELNDAKKTVKTLSPSERKRVSDGTKADRIDQRAVEAEQRAINADEEVLAQQTKVEEINAQMRGEKPIAGPLDPVPDEMPGSTDIDEKRTRLEARRDELQAQAEAARASNDLDTLDQANAGLTKIGTRLRSLANLERFYKDTANPVPRTRRQAEGNRPDKATKRKLLAQKKQAQRKLESADKLAKRERVKASERRQRAKDLRRDPDKKLGEAHEKVARLEGERDYAKKQVKAAIQKTRRFAEENFDQLTPSEKAAIRAQVAEELGVTAGMAPAKAAVLYTNKVRRLQKEIDDLNRQLEALDEPDTPRPRTRFEPHHPFESPSERKRTTERLRRERDGGATTPPRSRREVKDEKTLLNEQINDLKDRQAAALEDRKRAENQSAMTLRSDRIRALTAEKKLEKRVAREAPMFAELKTLFEQQFREAQEANYEAAIFIAQKAAQDRLPSGSPPFQQLLGTKKDKQRTGALAKAGKEDLSVKAWIDTATRIAKEAANTRLTQYLSANSSFLKTIDEKTGRKQSEFTEPEIRRMIDDKELKIEGEFLVDSKGKKFVKLDSRFLTDPQEMGNRIIHGAGGKKQSIAGLAETGVKEMDAQELKAMLADADGSTMADRLTQQFAQEGEGRKYALVGYEELKMLRGLEEELGKWDSFFLAVNRLNSKLVLGMSPSWALAQPIAEMLILWADHPNPVKLLKAAQEVKRIHDGPDSAAQRGLAMLAGNSVGISRSIRNTQMFHKDAEAGLKAINKTYGHMLMKEVATLEKPLGALDRKKGAFIREMGVLAEIDRELSTFRQVSKALMDNTDAMTEVSGILKNMNAEDRVKWLNSKEGIAAGERISRNIDAALGNWIDLKPGMERMIGSPIFFYPFLRFSINWTLRTFPKRHPGRWTAATMYGAFQAETLERLMQYDPQWMNQWAVAPIYGSQEGPPTAFFPLNRYAIAGNALTELSVQEGYLGFNIMKAINPLTVLPFRLGMNRLDAYGAPLTDANDLFGQPDAGFSTVLGQALDETFKMMAPPRELMRLTDFSFKEGFDNGLVNPFTIDSNSPFSIERKPGGDPNLIRDMFRRLLIAGIPIPAEFVAEGQNVDKIYEKREEGKTMEQREYGSVMYEGREQRLSEVGEGLTTEMRNWKKDKKAYEDREGFAYPEPMPMRSPREKKIVKRYLGIKGERAWGTGRIKEADFGLYEYHEDRGFKLDEESTVRGNVESARRQARKNKQEERENTRKKWETVNPGFAYPGYGPASKQIRREEAASNDDGLAPRGTPGTRQVPLSGGGYNYDATQPGYTPKTPITTYRDQPANTPPAERIPVGTGIEPMKNVLRKRQVAFAKKIRAQKVKAFGSGSAKISAPGLSKSQRTFAQVLAKETGLDPQVVGGWVLAEQGYASGDYEGRNYHNWLNIGPHMEAPEFSSPATAARATAAFLRGEKWGAGAGIPGILPNAVGKSPEEQVEVLRGSGWDAAGYQNGIPWQDVTATAVNTGNQQQAKEKFWQMVKRGKRMGVYEVPEGGTANPAFTGNYSPGGQGTTSTEWFAPDENTLLRFQPPLAQALLQLAKASGEPLQFNSGFRTRAEQEAAYADYLAGGTLAAVPGTSNHEFGRAADLSLTDKQRELLPEFGLGLPVPGEDWHVELVGDAANAYTDGMPQAKPTSPMQQVKAAERARAAAASGTGTTGGGTTGGTTSSTTESPGTQSNAMENLQNFRNPDGSILNWGTGTEMDLPSAAVSVSEANQNSESDKVKSVAESFAGLPKYVKPKPKKR
jgi:hypothetical protein